MGHYGSTRMFEIHHCTPRRSLDSLTVASIVRPVKSDTIASDETAVMIDPDVAKLSREGSSGREARTCSRSTGPGLPATPEDCSITIATIPLAFGGTGAGGGGVAWVTVRAPPPG